MGLPEVPLQDVGRKGGQPIGDSPREGWTLVLQHCAHGHTLVHMNPVGIERHLHRAWHQHLHAFLCKTQSMTAQPAAYGHGRMS